MIRGIRGAIDVRENSAQAILEATRRLLLALRESPAMGTLLVVHLGFVAGLFLTAPYGKFAHVVYRYAALVQNSIEQART